MSDNDAKNIIEQTQTPQDQTTPIVVPAPPPQEVRVVINRPRPEEMITPSFLNDSVVSKILKDSTLKNKFEKTLTELKSLQEQVKGEKCSGCEFNRKGKPFLNYFVEEIKSCTKEEQLTILTFLGKRTITSVNENWLNIATNELIPFEFRTIKMGQQIDPVVFKDLKGQKLEPPNVIKDRGNVKKVLFRNHQGPGDIVMLTAAIRDLHLNFPGKFITDIRTSFMHIWEGNPYVEWAKGSPLDEKDPEVKAYDLGYPLIHQSNQGPYHFSEAFTEEIEDILNIRIKRRIGKGDIHIRKEEDVWGWTERSTWFKEYNFDPQAEYWVIDAGHKQDFTCKFWGKGKFQAVVDYFKGKIQFVQIGHTAHIHPELNGVINLIGKTDDRQLIRLIWASSGVLTPVSLPMVLAAAIPVKPGTCNGKKNRPCVIVSGGREPSRWQADTNHQFVHTCGSLPCCDNGGCWTSRVKPLGDGDEKDVKNMCYHVTIDDYGEEVPYCMHMISAQDVIRRIEMYYEFYKDGRKKYSYNTQK